MTIIHVVFAEEDTLFRLMEMGLKRKLTPEGEKTLRYFFGSEFATPLEALTSMADRLGLPPDIDTMVCEDESKLDHALPTADFVVVEASTLNTDRVKACAPKDTAHSAIWSRVPQHRCCYRSRTEHSSGQFEAFE